MSSYITNTTKTWVTQHAMYAAAPSDQFRPVPGTPGAAGLGCLATLRKKNFSQRRTMQEKRPTLTVTV